MKKVISEIKQRKSKIRVLMSEIEHQITEQPTTTGGLTEKDEEFIREIKKASLAFQTAFVKWEEKSK